MVSSKIIINHNDLKNQRSINVFLLFRVQQLEKV